MKLNIGITDKNMRSIGNLLNRLLADEYVLYVKTRNYHWNVESSDFSELHAFFEKQYDELAEIIDEVAERSRQLGVNAVGTMREFLGLARLKEKAHDYPAAPVMIKNLLSDHESLIRTLRQDLKTASDEYDDMGTSDFLTGLMEQHEKMAWMLRAYLRK